MGMLVDGQWKVQEVNPQTKDGEFHRQTQKFRFSIEKGGEFEPESGRYHLYISHACPWAHRTLIMRALKGLEAAIDISIVAPDMLENGWSFQKYDSEVTGDKLFGFEYLKDVYVKADSKFTGRVTVPILWDKKTDRIVNNESSEIIRIFNSSFDGISKESPDYYPNELKKEIDEVNEDVYHNINNGVYKTGFARNQRAYEHNFISLFECLERQEKRLEGKEFLVGDTLTEADIRLWTTLVRFDAVYFTHFKCNKKMIKDYKNLDAYLKRLYAMPEFGGTTNLDHIKRHYYYSHETLNPFRLVPIGPELNFV